MSWSNTSKSTSSWSNGSQDTSSWSTQSQTYETQLLLKEDGYYLLLETGYDIVLEQATLPVWANQTQH